MASSTAAALSISATSTTLTDSANTSKASSLATAGNRQQSSQCSSTTISLPSLSHPLLPNSPVFHSTRNRLAKTTTYCRKLLARNVVAMATTSTGEAPPAEVDDTSTTETPEILKTIQQAWDKVEDKYAVTSLAVAGGIALIGSAGMISAIDKLPLVPGVLELVGIGYTGWFAYQNLINKPDRDSLVEKIKCTYRDIIGTS